MVWVKFKEKFYGKTYVGWKNKPSIASARTEARDWNQFNNPQEHLSIIGSSASKPKGIRKTKHRGIYKGEGRVTRKTKRRISRGTYLMGVRID